MGKTWKVYEPVHELIKTNSATSQDSAIYVTLPSGRKVLLVSFPKGNGADGYRRGNLTLWALDAKNKENIQEITTFREGSGNAYGAGYTSLAYKKGQLLVAYEDNGDIRVKSLTEHIAKIEELAEKWGLEDERSKEIEAIDTLEHLNNKQKEDLKEKLRDQDDNAVIISRVLNREVGELSEKIEEKNNEKKAFDKALPSKMRKLDEALAEAMNRVVDKENGEAIDIKNVKSMGDKIDDSFAALNEKLDFDKYIGITKKLSLVNNNILDNTDSNISASLEFKKNKVNANLAITGDINDKVSVGGFATYSKDKDVNQYSLGTNLNLNFNGNEVKSFVRYRAIKLAESENINHSVDAYTSYSNRLAATDKLTVTPKIGVLASYSPTMKVDEDLQVDGRFTASFDASLKLEYEISGLKFKVKPEIIVDANTVTLSQTNDRSNKVTVVNEPLKYSFETGVSKELGLFNVGDDLTVNGTKGEKPEVGFKLKSGFNW